MHRLEARYLLSYEWLIDTCISDTAVESRRHAGSPFAFPLLAEVAALISLQFGEEDSNAP